MLPPDQALRGEAAGQRSRAADLESVLRSSNSAGAATNKKDEDLSYDIESGAAMPGGVPSTGRVPFAGEPKRKSVHCG